MNVFSWQYVQIKLYHNISFSISAIEAVFQQVVTTYISQIIVQGLFRTCTQFKFLWRLISSTCQEKWSAILLALESMLWQMLRVWLDNYCDCFVVLLLFAAAFVVALLSHSRWNICTHKLRTLRVAYAFKLCGIIQNINMNLRRGQQGQHEAQGGEGQRREWERVSNDALPFDLGGVRDCWSNFKCCPSF